MQGVFVESCKDGDDGGDVDVDVRALKTLVLTHQHLV